MNERTISTLKKVRTGLQIAAEPVDRLARFLNYKKGYPPLYLRQKVGSLNDFEASGAEYMVYLKQLCGLKPGMDVLDVGCGCGLMCLKVNENPTLPEYIYPGKYVGVDTDAEAISWCTKHLANGNTNFYYLSNPAAFGYNRKRNKYDIILCKSLFTHLLPEEVVNYLAEIGQLLQQHGKCLATFFLLTAKARLGRYRFEVEMLTGKYAVEKAGNPRAAIAYNREWVLDILAKMGVEYNVFEGSWRGDNKGLSFQDIVILTKE